MATSCRCIRGRWHRAKKCASWTGLLLSGSRPVPVAPIENLYEFLPESLPFGFPSFDPFQGLGLDRGSTFRPVHNQQLFDESDHLGIITHRHTLPGRQNRRGKPQSLVGSFGCLTQSWRRARQAGISTGALPGRSSRVPYQPFSALQVQC